MRPTCRGRIIVETVSEADTSVSANHFVDGRLTMDEWKDVVSAMNVFLVSSFELLRCGVFMPHCNNASFRLESQGLVGQKGYAPRA